MSDDDFDFDIDFGNVQEFKPLPAGDYVCTVSDATLEKSKKGDSFNFVISLEVEQPEEYSGRSLRSWVNYYRPNPFGVLQMAGAVLQMDLSDYSGSARQLVEQLPGNSVGVTVKEDTYDGKPTNNVTAWWTPGGEVSSLYASLDDEPI